MFDLNFVLGIPDKILVFSVLIFFHLIKSSHGDGLVHVWVGFGLLACCTTL